MQFHAIPIWKEAPFLRLLIPFAGGVLMQWNFQFGKELALVGVAVPLLIMALFSSKTISWRFRMYWLEGVLLNCLFLFAGSVFTFLKDGRSEKALLLTKDTTGPVTIATLEEPLSEKAKSFKTVASIRTLEASDSAPPLNGRIIIYLQKDSGSGHASGTGVLGYGSTIIFKKSFSRSKAREIQEVSTMNSIALSRVYISRFF